MVDRRHELFVAEYGSNAVNIYTGVDNREGGTLLGTITAGIAGPIGVWVDRNATLYVANSSDNAVTEYVRGSNVPATTVTLGVSQPSGVAVDSHGTLYVGNFASSGGYVDEYPAGSNAPSARIKGLQQPEEMAFDANDNLYIADNGSGGSGSGAIWKVPFGKTALINLGLEDLSNPLGVSLDANGDLFVSDDGLLTDEIFVFQPGHKAPSCVISQGFPEGTTPGMIALANNATLYAAQQNNNPYERILPSVLTYLPGGYALRSETKEQMDKPVGVALWEQR